MKYKKYINNQINKEIFDSLWDVYRYKRGGNIKIYGGGRAIKEINKTTTKTNNAKNAELLYKSAKDAADHFYRMSKLVKTKDKKAPKALPLKYQEGGLAPFGVYTPLPYAAEDTSRTSGGSTSMWGYDSSAKKTSSTSSSSGDTEKLDAVIKHLLEKLDGLPSDVEKIANNLNRQFKLAKLSSLTGEVDTNDLEIRAIQALRQANMAKFNKA